MSDIPFSERLKRYEQTQFDRAMARADQKYAVDKEGIKRFVLAAPEGPEAALQKLASSAILSERMGYDLDYTYANHDAVAAQYLATKGASGGDIGSDHWADFRANQLQLDNARDYDKLASVRSTLAQYRRIASGKFGPIGGEGDILERLGDAATYYGTPQAGLRGTEGWAEQIRIYEQREQELAQRIAERSSRTQTTGREYKGIDWTAQQVGSLAQSILDMAPEVAAGALAGGGTGLYLKGGAGILKGSAGSIARQAIGAGAKAGVQIGSYGAGKSLEGGSIYGELIEAGVGHETADQVRTVVGNINGLIESVEFMNITGLADGTLAAAVKQSIRKGIRSTAGRGLWGAAAKEFAVRWAGNTAEETAQEVLQETSAILGHAIAQEVDNLPEDQRLTIYQAVNRLLDTAVQSAAGLSVISLPGATIRTAGEYGAMSKQRKALVQAIASNKDAAPEIQEAVRDAILDDAKLESFQAKQAESPSAFTDEEGPQVFYAGAGRLELYDDPARAAATIDGRAYVTPENLVASVRQKYGDQAAAWAQSMAEGKESASDAAMAAVGAQAEAIREAMAYTQQDQFDMRSIPDSVRNTYDALGIKPPTAQVIAAHIDTDPARTWKGTREEYAAAQGGDYDAWHITDEGRVILAHGKPEIIVPAGAIDTKAVRIPTVAGKLQTRQEGNRILALDENGQEAAAVEIEGDRITAVPDSPHQARQILGALRDEGRDFFVDISQGQRDAILATDAKYRSLQAKLYDQEHRRAELARELSQPEPDLARIEQEAAALDNQTEATMAALDAREADIMGERTLASMTAEEVSDKADIAAEANTGTRDGLVEQIVTVAPQIAKEEARAAVTLMEVYANARGLTLAQWADKHLAATAFTDADYGGKRGGVMFLEDGKALIALTNTSDPSTIIHEFGHIVRRQLDQADQAALLQHYQADTWTVDAEEAFARDWEAYFLQHKAPAELGTIFARILRMMRRVYGYVRTKLAPEVREVIDRAFLNHQQDLETITAAGQDYDALYQPAWHGTPHRFDRFTTAAMGTGEGAQAYGWGLYFAGKKEVAEHYRESLSDSKFFAGDRQLHGNESWAAQFYIDNEKNKQAAIADATATLKPGNSREEIVNYISSFGDNISENNGQIYQVEIPDDSEYLDWDKPLSKQSEKVKELIDYKKLGLKPIKHNEVNGEPWRMEDQQGNSYGVIIRGTDEAGFIESWTRKMRSQAEKSGRDWYKSFGTNEENTSKLLKAAGIPGIRYLDGTSRSDGEGTHNYVIFDENDIQIVETLYQGERLPWGPIPADLRQKIVTAYEAERKRPLDPMLSDATGAALFIGLAQLFKSAENAADFLERNGIHARSVMTGLIEIDDRILRPVLFQPAAPIDSEAFKDWFGDSKMVDKEGKPLVVYHGTNYRFESFDKNRIGSANDRGFYGEGFYFTFRNGEGLGTGKGEAEYYGKNIIEAYLKIENPYDISQLETYKGKRIGAMGTDSIAFLYNIAKQFPEVASKIYLTKKTKNNASLGEYELEEVPATVMPELVDKYAKTLIIDGPFESGNDKYVDGYVKTEDGEYIDVNGKTVKFSDPDWLGHTNAQLDKEELELVLIGRAIEKYDGIEPSYHPEGYMTRNPAITEAIKKNGYDGIIQSKFGDEVVVFEPNQIKSVNNTGAWNPEDPRILYQPEYTIPAETRAHMDRLDTLKAAYDQADETAKPAILAEYLDLQEKVTTATGVWLLELENAYKAGEIIPDEAILEAADLAPWAADELAFRRTMDTGAMEAMEPEDDYPEGPHLAESIPRTRKEHEAAFLAYFRENEAKVLTGIRDTIRGVRTIDDTMGAGMDEVTQAQMIGLPRLMPGPWLLYVNANDPTRPARGQTVPMVEVARQSTYANPSRIMAAWALAQGDLELVAVYDKLDIDEPLSETKEAKELAEKDRVKNLDFEARVARLRDILKTPLSKAGEDALGTEYREASLELRRLSVQFEKEAAARREIERRHDSLSRAYQQKQAKLAALETEYASETGKAATRERNLEKTVDALKDRREQLKAEIAKIKAQIEPLVRSVKRYEEAKAGKRLAQKDDEIAAIKAAQKRRDELRRAREYHKALVNQIKRPVSGKVDFEYAAQIYNLQRIIDPKQRARGLAGLNYFMDARPAYAQAVIDAVGKAVDHEPAPDGFTIEQLEDILAEIVVLEHEGKAKRQAYLDEEARKVSGGIFQMQRRLAEQHDAAALEKLGKPDTQNKLAKVLASVQETQHLADQLDGAGLTYDGPFYRNLYEQMQTAASGMARNIARRMDAIDALMKEYGITRGQLYAPLENNGKPVTITRQTVKGGRRKAAEALDEKVSMDKAIGIYMANQDDKSRAAVQYGNLISQSEINAIVDALPENAKKFANALTDAIFTQDYDRLAATMGRVENKQMGKVDRYFPMMRQAVAGKFEEDLAFEQMSRGGTQRNPRKGMTQDRQEIGKFRQTPIRLDAMAVIVTAIERQERYIAFAETVKRIGKMLGRSDAAMGLTIAMENIKPGSTRAFLDWTARVVNGDSTRTELDQALMKIKRNFGTFAMGFNVGSAIKNVSGLALYLGEASPAKILEAATAGPRKYKEMRETMLKLAPELHNRSLDRADAMSRKISTRRDLIAEKYRIIAFWLMRQVVQRMDTIGWTATFNTELSNGRSTEQAAAMATAAVLRTQPTGDALAMSEAETSILGSVLSPFASQAYKVFNLVTATPNWTKRAAVKRYLMRIVAIATSAAVFTGIIPLLKSAVRGPDDEPEDDLVNKFLVNLTASNIPLFGGIASGIIEGFGTKHPLDTQFSALGPIIKGIQKIIDHGGLEAKQMLSIIGASARSISAILGIPYTQLKRIVEAGGSDEELAQRLMTALVGR